MKKTERAKKARLEQENRDLQEKYSRAQAGLSPKKRSKQSSDDGGGGGGIIHFATISVVHVVMDIFINQGASKLFIDFCFVFAEVRNSGVFCTCACVLLLRWS